ncbi:MAG: SdpI family protein [Candidatus Buchananbacteria bacterium]
MKSPIKLGWKSEALPIAMIIVSIVLSFVFYKYWPEKVATHWNFYGQVDAYGPKAFMAFFFPFLLLGMYALFTILPYIDPKRDRYQEFSKTFHIFKDCIIAVLFIVYVATGIFNLGYDINIGYIISFVIGAMMIVLGNYMGKIKYNWFMGIRTPWTMSSENVWNRTHRVGGWFFIIFGLLIIITPYLPILLGTITFISGVALVLVGTMLYSYIVYRQEKKGN